MNGSILFAGYLLVGLGIALTTAPERTALWARVLMVPGWLAFFLVAAVLLAIDRGDRL